jgi:peptidoglycan/LPS O-acetylase OafA/YrhL
MPRWSAHLHPIPSNSVSEFMKSLLENGGRGVPLFFAISGMVVGLPFARHHLHGHNRVSWKPYLLRRLTRLEPPYIVNLLLRFSLLVAVKHISFANGLRHLALTLLYSDWVVLGTMPILHLPSWSLAVEVQFYLLAPILAWWLFRRSDAVRWLISILLIAAASVMAAHMPGTLVYGPLNLSLRLSLLNFSQYFLVGLLMADLYLTALPRWQTGLFWDIIAIPSWLAFFAIPRSLVAMYLMPLLLIIIFCAAFKGRVVRAFLRQPLIATLGGMCYSIYLTHSITLQGGDVLLNRLDHLLNNTLNFWEYFALTVLLVLPVILAIATVFFVMIERPCMDKRWPSKLLSTLRSTAIRSERLSNY